MPLHPAGKVSKISWNLTLQASRMLRRMLPPLKLPPAAFGLSLPMVKAVAVYNISGALVEKIYSYAGKEIVIKKGVYIIQADGKVAKVRL